jgi:two-component system OmpR family response regulator
MEQIPHILIVDDDREIRELLARFLEKNQMRVTAVRDGREARRAWTNGHYQLVVLDLMLPGESYQPSEPLTPGGARNRA